MAGSIPPGFYPHKSGPYTGKFEYWTGSGWEGQGRVFNSLEEAQRSRMQGYGGQPSAGRRVGFGAPQSGPQGGQAGYGGSPAGYGGGPQGGQAGYGGSQAGIPQGWQSGNGQGAAAGAGAGAGQVPQGDAQDGNGALQQPTDVEKKGGKPSKKRRIWPWVLLAVFLIAAGVGGAVVYGLSNTPAVEVQGSAKPAPDVDMKVGETKKGVEKAEAGAAENGALSKEQLEQKAQEAEKAGNDGLADYYRALKENAPEAADNGDSEADPTVSANRTAALAIGKGIATGQCAAVKAQYAEGLDDTQFSCEGYDANNGEVSVVSDEKSDATGIETFALSWGADAGKQQGATVVFNGAGEVTSVTPVVNPVK